MGQRRSEPKREQNGTRPTSRPLARSGPPAAPLRLAQPDRLDLDNVQAIGAARALLSRAIALLK